MTAGMEQIWLVTFEAQNAMVILAPNAVEAATMAMRVTKTLEWTGAMADIASTKKLQCDGFGVIASFNTSEDLLIETDHAPKFMSRAAIAAAAPPAE